MQCQFYQNVQVYLLKMQCQFYQNVQVYLHLIFCKYYLLLKQNVCKIMLNTMKTSSFIQCTLALFEAPVFLLLDKLSN